MLKSYLAASAATFLIFVVIDFIWLSNAARLFYRPNLGALLLDRPALAPALVFYVLYGFGLALLVVRPSVDAGSVVTALWMGGLFGLVAYGTYGFLAHVLSTGTSCPVAWIDNGLIR